MTHRIRMCTTLLGLLVLVATAGLFSLDVRSPVRVLVAVLFVVFVPGWATIGLLKLDNVAANVALSTTFSLMLGILVAQILVWQGWYSAGLTLLVLAAISVPCLLLQMTLALPRAR